MGCTAHPCHGPANPFHSTMIGIFRPLAASQICQSVPPFGGRLCCVRPKRVRGKVHRLVDTRGSARLAARGSWPLHPPISQGMRSATCLKQIGEASGGAGVLVHVSQAAGDGGGGTDISDTRSSGEGRTRRTFEQTTADIELVREDSPAGGQVGLMTMVGRGAPGGCTRSRIGGQ